MKEKKLSIGTSDFKEIITNDLYFIDKSLFIKDVEDGMKVILYPRPRRFGKTLNLSMLKYFYDINEDNSQLFKDLKIATEKDIMQKQGKHPVIFLTFKEVKDLTPEKCIENICNLITNLYIENKYLLESNVLSKYDIQIYEKILSKTASEIEYKYSLKKLTEYLYLYHQIKPVVLIDEYDTPIHVAYHRNYYDNIIDFFRMLLGAALKDNTFLEKGVMTGILRVSMESMYSDLNNVYVYSMMSRKAIDKFGFTDAEVEKLIADFDFCIDLTEIKNYYNGYNFNGIAIYNPWSVLKCVEEIKLGQHWIRTSGNDLIRSLCQNSNENIKKDLEILLEGGKLPRDIDENVVFSELQNRDIVLWNFFLMCGYLRYDDLRASEGGFMELADLSIPNQEIYNFFKYDIAQKWFRKPEKTVELLNLANLLTKGDLEVFRTDFTEYCANSFSYFDVSGKEPEKFYHAFVLGMLVCLRDAYLIRSNRETGYGRSDVMMIPFDKAARGVVFEFKSIDKTRGETLDKAIKNAHLQIDDRIYEKELKAHGIKEIVIVVAVFDGKEVKLEFFYR